MRGGSSSDDPTIKALLAYGRTLRPVPDAVRARVLERARGSLAAAVPPPQVAVPVIVMRRSWLRIAAAAAAFLALVAAGAVAAFRSHGPLDREVPTRSTSRSLPPLSAPGVRSASEQIVVEPLPTSEPPTRLPKPRESYAAELRLLQRAHAAYESGSFARTLALLSEHARRFPKGRLAEERDALRARSLLRAGRTAEARRAVETFGTHFPRSVLLPRLEEMLRATE